MEEYLKVKNWEKWQSYRKDRGQPPWIKVWRRLLRNLKWINLSDAEKGHLVSIWMLAADHEGTIPNDAGSIKVLCHLKAKPNLNKFIQLGFLTSSGCQDDVNVASSWRQGDVKVTPQSSTDKDRVKTDKKAKYYDCVFLSEEDCKKLNKKFGSKGAQERIINLNDYIMSKGKYYKSHYHTILTWERMRENKKIPDAPKLPYVNEVVVTGEKGTKKRDLSELFMPKEMP